MKQFQVGDVVIAPNPCNTRRRRRYVQGQILKLKEVFGIPRAEIAYYSEPCNECGGCGHTTFYYVDIKDLQK